MTLLLLIKHLDLNDKLQTLQSFCQENFNLYTYLNQYFFCLQQITFKSFSSLTERKGICVTCCEHTVFLADMLQKLNTKFGIGART